MKETKKKSKKEKGNEEKEPVVFGADVKIENEDLFGLVECGEKFQKREMTRGQDIVDPEAFFQWLISPVSLEEVFLQLHS